MRYTSLAERYFKEVLAASGGPPPRWNEWLDVKWEKGRALVPNPNPTTKKRFPQVSFTTALRDKGFKNKAKEEFAKWLEEQEKEEKANPEKEKPEDQQKKKPKNPPLPPPTPPPIIKPTEEETVLTEEDLEIIEEEEEGKEDHEEEEHPAPKKTWKESLADMSSKAKQFFEKAPKSVQKFATDEQYRRDSLLKAHKSLTEAPEKATNALLKTLKEEVHEYKEAAGAVKALATGKKINKHQKHALKTAAFHVGLTVAATALTTTGLGAGAAMFAKSMARHVALKAVGSMFEKMHILDEIGHIGHGVKHILDKLAAAKKEKKQEVSEDRLLLDFIRALIAKEMEGISPEDVAEAMELASRKDATVTAAHRKLATRYLADHANQIRNLLFLWGES